MDAQDSYNRSSPFDATPEQLEALWDVADAAKTMMSFLGGFVARGANRKQLGLNVLLLGRALTRLTRITNEQRPECIPIE